MIDTHSRKAALSDWSHARYGVEGKLLSVSDFWQKRRAWLLYYTIPIALGKPSSCLEGIVAVNYHRSNYIAIVVALRHHILTGLESCLLSYRRI